VILTAALISFQYARAFYRRW
jgi:hypothetical protein